MKRKILMILGLVTFLSSTKAQRLNLYFLEADSTPCIYASVQFYPSNLTLVTDQEGRITVDSSYLFSADSLVFSHITYESFSISVQELQFTDGQAALLVTPKLVSINDVRVLNNSRFKIYEKMQLQFKRYLSDTMRVFYGFFGYHETQNDTLICSLISDVLVFHGGANPNYFSEHGLEWEIPHLVITHMGSGYYINTNFSSQGDYKVLDSLIKYVELDWADKFTYGNGPLAQKYAKYYNYVLDSVVGDTTDKKYYFTYTSKSKVPSKKFLVGTGKITLNHLYLPEQIVHVNPIYPIRYPLNFVHFYRKKTGAVNIDTVRLQVISDRITPTYISHTLHFANGRKIFTFVSITGHSKVGVKKVMKETTMMSTLRNLSPLLNPIVFPVQKNSDAFTDLIKKNQQRYNIVYTYPQEPICLFDPNFETFSFSNRDEYYRMILNFRTELWHIYTEIF